MLHTYSNCSLKTFTENINSDFSDNDKIISILLQSIKSRKITHLENMLISDFKIKTNKIRTNSYKVLSAVIQTEEMAEPIIIPQLTSPFAHKCGGRFIRIPQKARPLALKRKPKNSPMRFRDF